MTDLPPPPPPPPASPPPPPPPPPPGPGMGAYPEKSQAGLALGLSIFGFLCCGIAGIVGLIFGKQEMDGIAAGRRDPSQLGMAKAAFYIGIAAAVLWAIGILANAIGAIRLFGS